MSLPTSVWSAPSRCTGTSGGSSDRTALKVVVLPASRGIATTTIDSLASTAAHRTAAMRDDMVPLRIRSTMVTLSGVVKAVNS